MRCRKGILNHFLKGAAFAIILAAQLPAAAWTAGNVTYVSGTPTYLAGTWSGAANYPDSAYSNSSSTLAQWGGLTSTNGEADMVYYRAYTRQTGDSGDWIVPISGYAYANYTLGGSVDPNAPQGTEGSGGSSAGAALAEAWPDGITAKAIANKSRKLLPENGSDGESQPRNWDVHTGTEYRSVQFKMHLHTTSTANVTGSGSADVNGYVSVGWGTIHQ